MTFFYRAEARGYNKIFAYHLTLEVYSNEKLLARISIMWSLVNLTTKTCPGKRCNRLSQYKTISEKREEMT